MMPVIAIDAARTTRLRRAAAANRRSCRGGTARGSGETRYLSSRHRRLRHLGHSCAAMSRRRRRGRADSSAIARGCHRAEPRNRRCDDAAVLLHGRCKRQRAELQLRDNGTRVGVQRHRGITNCCNRVGERGRVMCHAVIHTCLLVHSAFRSTTPDTSNLFVAVCIIARKAVAAHWYSYSSTSLRGWKLRCPRAQRACGCRCRKSRQACLHASPQYHHMCR